MNRSFLERWSKSRMKKTLAALAVGSRIYFFEEKLPYRIKARSDRYLVCTKPFSLKKTVLYTIVDIKLGIRGPENLIFGMGAETVEQCQNMVARLEGREKPETPQDLACIRAVVPDWKPMISAPTEVSHRNRIFVNVMKVIPA